MISKETFIESFLKELSIIRHLATKVTPEMLDYRPTDKQRSLLELLNYLGHIFIVGTTATIAGDATLYKTLIEKAPKVTLENFDSVMDQQMKELEAKLRPLTEEDFEKEYNSWGHVAPTSVHLHGVMKWAVAYKMQLFLYIKANGNHDISTSNLWRGVDMAPKQ